MIQRKIVRRVPVQKPGVVSRNTGLETLIQQSTGQVSIFHTSWLVIGLPGIGKSTLFSGFEDVLFLVTSEKEVKRLNVPYILIDSWEKMLIVTDKLVDEREKYPYKFIAVDFIDAVWTLCVQAVCKKFNVPHTSDASWGKGSDTVDWYFKAWFSKLIASDYSVLLVSHVNQREVSVDGVMKTKTICTLPPKARTVLFPLVNVIGCMEYRSAWVDDPRLHKKVNVNRRVISFQGNEYIEAKDRDSALPTSEIVLSKDPKVNYQMFKEYYEGKRQK
jgi:hypothetical protein